ncbi:hypothetical protein EPN27_03895 [Patescibacteria group bacterium]|nr:MAG: hypothetical protein EPN27_03895 [Patescibacteria group bacterium]
MRTEKARKIENRKSKTCPANGGIENAVEEFIRYQETIGRSSSTLESYRTNLKYWQKYLAEQKIGDTAEGGTSTAKSGINLAAVTPQVVAGYQAWVYNYQTRFKRPFGISTQIQILNNLQVFYQYLVKTGQVLNNPADVIRLPKEPRKLPAVVLTPKEMKKLLAQPDMTTVLGFRDRTMYEVLYSTGLRVGELVHLRIQDISFSDGMLFIHAGKGGKDRVVPIGETARRFLAEYIKNIRPMFRQASATDVLFFNKQGRPHKRFGVWHKLKLYAARAGIKSEIRRGGKRITVHTFRHTLATEMLKHGADLRQIQEMLGHTSLGTTQLYTHVVKDELKRVQEQCHPREQTELPENFICYRGRKYLTADDRRELTLFYKTLGKHSDE